MKQLNSFIWEQCRHETHVIHRFGRWRGGCSQHLVVLRTDGREWFPTMWLKISDKCFLNYSQMGDRIKLSPTTPNESQGFHVLFDILINQIHAAKPKWWTNREKNVFDMADIRHYNNKTESLLHRLVHTSCCEHDPGSEKAQTIGGVGIRWLSLWLKWCHMLAMLNF